MVVGSSKFILYERLPMQLVNSPWLHNLLIVVAKIGPGVKYPTPYEISKVYLESISSNEDMDRRIKRHKEKERCYNYV